MNFKKHEIMATERNYDVHIFMHQGDDVGSQGFNIKRRKSLSDDERREIEMQVTTGKVNQLGLEKSYFDNASSGDEVASESDRGNRKPRDNNRRKNNNRRGDNRDRLNNNRNEKKSFFGKLFSFGNSSN